MKLTVLDQYAKGLVHCDQTLGEEIRDKIERLKWSLWHGNLSKASAILILAFPWIRDC